MTHPVQQPRFRPSRLPEGIVLVEWEPRIRFTDEDAAAVMSYVRGLDARPLPMLVRPQGMLTISRGALDAFAGTRWVSAMAVTGRSLIDGFLLGIYHEVYRPRFPVRHFDEESRAIRWLRAQDR